MPLFFLPERVRVVVELGPDTLTLINRIVDLADQGPQIRALTARLNASSGALADAVKANPDPNPTD